MKKLFVILLLLASISNAQELNAKVEVNYESLPISYREKLQDFAQVVESYLNSNSFTGMDWQWEKINCSFNIFFTSASNETNYSAQVVITSQRPIQDTKNYSLMLRIMDDSWDFRYENGQSMYFDLNNFDPLTSFLDFYALIILGFDSESYDIYGGSDYFNQADNIAVQGASSGYSNGWELTRDQYNKRGLLQDLLNAKYQKFRENFTDYHRNGLDLLESKPDFALKNMAKLVENLYEIKDNIDSRNVLLRVFFNAKYNELCDKLKFLNDPVIFDKLMVIDPSHTSKYKTAQESLE